VTQQHAEQIDRKLKDIRLKYNYHGEIHFNKFPKSFGGNYGIKPKVAKEWFLMWKEELSEKIKFNVLAVNG